MSVALDVADHPRARHDYILIEMPERIGIVILGTTKDYPHTLINA